MKPINALAKKFDFWSLLKFTAPTIIMMVIMSLYTMVDGVFVSNLIGENALSAINIVFPLFSIVTAIAIMLATGGNAVIAKKMGEGKDQEAKENFTLIVVVGVVVGIVCMIVGLVFLKPIVRALGATDVLFDYCYEYTKILLFLSPLAVLQMLFQYFFVAASKPYLGLATTIGGGLANVILDYVFIVPCNMGVAGAALATGIGWSIPAIVGLIYFTLNHKGTLHFTKPRFDANVLLQSCANGSSEMVTNLASAIMTFLFNIIMLKLLGENGVAAITIVLYSQFLLTAIFLGFSSGVAPVISYNFGEKNAPQLKKLFHNSLITICASSLLIFVASIAFAPAMVTIFVRAQSEVYEIALQGILLFSISYLFTGVNIFASAMFTAYSDGKVSAIISFARTFVFFILGILLLPLFFGTNGVWLAVPLAEALTLILCIIYFVKLRNKYMYA